MIKHLQLLLIALTLGFNASATEYHVAKIGSDRNSGTLDSPFLTIQAASNLAQPGDMITVHQGIYREWINPPRGGTSNAKRIVWKAKIPRSFFGDYNPFTDQIKGDWFMDKGRIHHTGEVYLNGKSLWEMVLHDYFLHTGDKATVRELLPSASKFINLLVSWGNLDGIIESPPYGYWIDHADLDRSNANFAFNALYMLTMKDYAEILRWMGNDEEAQKFEDKIAAR